MDSLEAKLDAVVQRVRDANSAADDAEALAGMFPPDQFVEVSRGHWLARQFMTPEHCRQRLALIANDERPEREAERDWLLAAVREGRRAARPRH